MTADRWWWAQKAQQLKFTQLEAARKQAENWRTGLVGVTSLLGAVLIVKGRDNFTTLARPYPLLVLALFGLGVVALLLATLAAIRAASGAPGDEIMLNGEELRAWTEIEVIEVHRAIRVARVLTIMGICAVFAGAATAWFAPARTTPTPLVRIHTPAGQLCGRLLHLGDGVIRVGETGRYHLVPLTSTIHVETVETCP
ncbi:hypothetical protein O7626_16745 [Micromonospora sp. WMMD1102]|uniref:hypothetical protein n=1 Tax=Micromonospora sp. WMMD1102 TaxID=3016105 RepID=UPI002414F788|nr:hypothetical protein [Micromonospora sp. WMMD1102]MDG4787563.1 hypothetical protein [Micromonospora sp. WMMD1102]